jgi:TldD protein
MPFDVDADFLAIPLHRLADAALQRARDFGVEHADFRLERLRSQNLRLRDGVLQGAHDGVDVGFAVRVIVDGTWGFASTVELTQEAAVRITEEAVRVAQVSAAISSERIELAAEPVYTDATWVSAYEVDPLDVPIADKVELLGGWSRQLMAAGSVQHVSAAVSQVVENKFYADLAGTTTTQQRVRLYPQLEAHGVDEASGRFDAMRTLAPPVGRGWEYLTDGYDWSTELAGIPHYLEEKLRAPSVNAGDYDLVIDPSNLLADDSRVDRSRHRARPCAGLRGQLRRHLVRHLRQARHACVRLRGHERHR